MAHSGTLFLIVYSIHISKAISFCNFWNYFYEKVMIKFTEFRQAQDILSESKIEHYCANPILDNLSVTAADLSKSSQNNM